MLNELQDTKTINDIINVIKDFYTKYDNDDYIPALLKEGYFTFDQSSSEHSKESSEFYAKLIIRPDNHKLDKSWQKSNLSMTFVDGSYILESNEIESRDYIYNVIVNRRMYGNNIYCLNPILCNDDYIDEENYKNDGIVNAFYFDGDDRVPVLKKIDDGNLKVYKKALEIYASPKGINEYPRYVLSVEFEYRNTVNHISDMDDYITETEYVDNVSKKNEKSDDKSFLWLIGTIDIPFSADKKSDLNIIVNSIAGGKRPLNVNNYNDDMEAGLVVFSHACLNFLLKRYVIIGLSMVDMFSDSTFLIDTMEDIVIFWEGEFNNLPYDVKKGLESYNDKVRSNNIISPTMFDWQLQGNWNALDNADPFQRLGYYLLENHKELVLEYQCNIYLPIEEEEFVAHAENILKILKFDINDLEKNIVPDDVHNEICNLLTMHSRINKENKLSTLYQSFALLLLCKVDSDYARRLFKKQN